MYSNKIICNILKYIDENINSKITIEDLERKFFYNRYYIMKLFKKEFGITIIEYINSLRVYNSFFDIKNSESQIINIAYKNGFYSLEYFSETFKRFVGVNPQTAKRYLKNKKNISIKEIDIINNSIYSLFYIKQKKEKYLLNQRPNTILTKKLSIFK